MKQAENSIKLRKFLDEYSNTLDIKASALAAGYKRQTASANGHNILKSERAQRELKELTAQKARHLQVCKGFIVDAYLKILDWALDKNENGRLNEPALALRALDGITRQIESRFLATKDENDKEQKTEGKNDEILSAIGGLDPEKI